MNSDAGLTRVAVLCGSCSCGCPEVFVDHSAAEDRRIVVTDDFGQKIQMSADQFTDLIAQAQAGQLEELLCRELHRKHVAAPAIQSVG